MTITNAVRASAPNTSEAVPAPMWDQAAFPTAPAARAYHRIVVLLAYLPILRREIDRGLEDDTITFLIAVVFVVGAVLLWGRWTDAFWMWR